MNTVLVNEDVITVTLGGEALSALAISAANQAIDTAAQVAADALAASGSAHSASDSATAASASQVAAAASDLAASGSATTAGNHAGSASGYASNASNSAAAASGSAAMAEEWAENPEDTAITGHPGRFSALHHATKAADAEAAVALLAIPLTGMNLPAHGTTLTPIQCTNTIISNYGQSGAVDLTLPAAASGLNFILSVGSALASPLRIKAAAGEVIYLDGVAGVAGGYVGILNPVVSATLVVYAFRTGASTYSWCATSDSHIWEAASV